MKNVKLFYLVLGATLPGKHTEQHDVLFCVGSTLAELTPIVQNHWEKSNEVHLDGWREVTNVNGYEISVVEKGKVEKNGLNLFFLNLGGYKTGSFSEHHCQQLVVAPSIAEAVKIAKQNIFCFEHTINENSRCHVDNKYGIDVEASAGIFDIMYPGDQIRYSLSITPTENSKEDEIHIGYFPLDKLK
jgi:Domain of Unknown Function (DUF1543).